MKSPEGWKRPFDDAIPLPRGRSLVTLENAGAYITKLPKAVHEAAEWQAAMEALILVATLGGPTMFARIGVMRDAGSWRGTDDGNTQNHFCSNRLFCGIIINCICRNLQSDPIWPRAQGLRQSRAPRSVRS